jgi:pyruvate,water dikinase
MSQGARLEVQHAGIKPPSLRVNGPTYPISAWKKPGLMEGMRLGRGRKRVQAQIETQLADMDAVTARVRDWYEKTREMDWSQAELLQVMEQVERIGLDAMVAFLTARSHLDRTYNRLIWATLDQAPFPGNLNLINNAIGDLDSLIESEIAADLLAVADASAADAPSVDWLTAGDYGEWWKKAAHTRLAGELANFLDKYAHRCAGEGEMAAPRWGEDQTPLLHAVRSMVEQKTRRPAKLSPDHAVSALQNAAGKEAKQVPALVQSLRQGLRLQSKAMNALAYLLSGTRNWALAAGAEAIGDGRLQSVEDVFLFELEEIKRMMTGEWNVSDQAEIQALASERRSEQATVSQAAPPPAFLGDRPLTPAYPGLPGSSGEARGPLRRWEALDARTCSGSIAGAMQLDSGWSILLPAAQGFVSACGAPFDPLAAAARLWRTPIITGLGDRYADLVEGAQTMLDTEQVRVEQ